MFNHLGDLRKLAKEAILIEHFASMNLITVQADEPAIEVLALMTADDFDVIPVVEGKNWIGYIEKKDISSLTYNDRGKCISELQDKLLKPFDKAKFVDLDDKKANSLQMAFEYLTNEWFFVGRSRKIEGIVTLEDFGKPAVSLYLLAKLLMVEAGLRRLWGTYTNKPTTDSPSKDGVDGDPKYFKTVLNNIRWQSANAKQKNKSNLLTDLKYEDYDLDFMVDLRNELAHGRNILSYIKFFLQNVVDRNKAIINVNKEIDKVLEAISRLEDYREQVWKAYEATHIVKRTLKEECLVGYNIMDLPPNLLSSPAIYIISAANPSGEVLSEEKNTIRTNALRDVLNNRRSKNNGGKWKYEEVVGQSPDKKWKQESFAIGGINKEEARKLAEMFGQRAVFELTQDYICVIPTDRGDENKREFKKLNRNVNLRLKLAKDNR